MFYHFFIRGEVQGVGFRHYVYEKANSLGFFGFVRNLGDGVEIVVNDADFISKLDDIPPWAGISKVEKSEFKDKTDFIDFRIVRS